MVREHHLVENYIYNVYTYIYIYMHVPILQTMKKTHTVARLFALKKVVGRQEMASMPDDVPHPAQPVLPQQSTAAKAADAVGGGFKHFLFSTLVGEKIQFD